MSMGRLRLPSSAIVVPFTFAPDFRSDTGIFTSGVQVYAARIICCLLISYGTKVRTGELVSNRPCWLCQISTPVALDASWNGYGIERRLDENSSFERPAMKTLPLTYFNCVMVSMRCRSCVG